MLVRVRESEPSKMIDHTHKKNALSWVASANGHRNFPIQNLPLGMFSENRERPKPGVAIGDKILDIRAAIDAGIIEGFPSDVFAAPDLKSFLALKGDKRRALRHSLFELLAEGSPKERTATPLLRNTADCEVCLPVRPGGFTDFYAGIVHAQNVGKLFRPDNPLLANYKYVPIGYHGRTSSIAPSGSQVRRPLGQTKAQDSETPVFGPCARLDYEVELGIWIGGGNPVGEPIPISEAGDQVAAMTLLNDWSARDIQAWEYQPLGPFLAKNFASTISPWLVTAEALAPFRTQQAARPEGDPAPLPYLWDDADQQAGAFLIDIDVAVRTARMRAQGMAPQIVGSTSARHLYWTPAQFVAHHTSNGCPLEPGDLLGTGTISAPDKSGFGSLLELTDGGKAPFKLGEGEERRFLEDGDEVVMTGQCRRAGFASIGFGECRALVLPAPRQD